LPGGPVGPPARWAATSNVEVGQTIFLVNRGMVRREGQKGARYKITKRRGRKWEWKWGGIPGRESGGLCMDICAGIPEFLVTNCRLSWFAYFARGRFEEPVRRCVCVG